MNVLNKLTVKYLTLNKRRAIITIIGIMLSGAMISTVFTLITSFQDLLIRSEIKNSGNYHATFPDVSYDKLEDIESNRYISKTMVKGIVGYSILEKSTNEYKPYMYILEYDNNSFENMPIELIKGRYPQKSNEIVISNHILTNVEVELKIGEEINLDIGNRENDQKILYQGDSYIDTEELIINQSIKYTIVGIIERPQFENYTSPGYTVITYLNKNKTDDKLYNVSVLTKNPRDIYNKMKLVAKDIGLTPTIIDNKESYNITYNENLLRMLGVSDDQNISSFFYGIGTIIVVLIMIGSIGVIYNSFAISVTERKKQFGILRSVGATRKQIVKNVLYEAFLIGIIATPLGIISGLFGIGITLKVVNKLLVNSISSDLNLRLIVSPLVIGLSILFIFLTIILSVIFPAIKTAKTSPIDAIRMSNDIKIKGKNVKTSKLTRKIFGIEGEIALKNMKRNRRKYRTTIFSLFISIILFISFNSFINYGFNSSDMYFNDVNRDIDIGITNMDKEQLELLLASIRDIKEIDEMAVLKSMLLVVSVSEDNINNLDDNINMLNKYEDNMYHMPIIFATYDNEYLNKYFTENNQNINNYKENEIIYLNKIRRMIFNDTGDTKILLQDILKIKQNDKLQLNSFEIKEQNIKYDYLTTVTVNSIVEKSPLGLNNSMPFMIAKNETYDKLHSSNYEDQLKIAINSKKHKIVEEKINKLIKTTTTGQINIHNYANDLEQQRNMIIVISIFLYGFISLITLIGVTNIFNTITTNIYLRSTEFAVLRSIGLTKKGLNRILNFESIFYGLKALLYGLPVSILISYLMHRTFNNVFETRYRLPLEPILIATLGVFLIVFSTMIYASKKIKKNSIVETIRIENI